MKNIFILQNSQNFTINIAKISNPTHYRLFLLINPISYQKLYERKQHTLFEKIVITNDFSFNTAKKHIDKILNEYADIPINIVTNSEWCVNVCGQLRSHYQLPGLNAQVANRFTNKLVMKAALLNKKINLPRHLELEQKQFHTNKNYINTIISTLGFPVFVKPIDDANSNGAEKLDNMIMLKTWLKTHNKKKNFELDEYITGKLYHCDSFIKNGKILYTQISEYTKPVFEYLQGNTLGSITLPEHKKEFIQLEKFNRKVLSALEYSGSGITHLEVFITNENKIIFLEIAARAGGAWLAKLYHKHLNVRFLEANLLLQIKEDYTLHFDKKGPYCACLWFPATLGVIDSFNIPSIKSQHEINFFAQAGQTTQKPVTINDKIAEIFLWNTNFTELYTDFNALKNFRIVNYK